MSETTTAPQSEAGTAPDESAAQTTPEATAPAEEGAATETTTDDRPKPNREERRIARLTARLAAEGRERERLAAELATLRQRPSSGQEPPLDDAELDRRAAEKAEALVRQREVQNRVDAFHEAGRAEYRDWQEKCQALIDMGADQQFSELLVEMPEGAKVAAALADDPDEMERIAAMKSERARAIALGKYAATLESRAAPQPSRQVSSAPPPIRPVTGPARVQFNETTASPQQLVEYYSKQEMERRRAAAR